MRVRDSVAEPDQLAEWYLGEEGSPPVRTVIRPNAKWIRQDWAKASAIAAGMLVALVAVTLVAAFQLNHPSPFIPYHDTREYVRRADIIRAGGAWADPARMPGYPLLLAALFFFAGRSNLLAADWLQAGLFVATAVAVYALALRIWRRVGVALVIGVIFASNLYIFSYVKPILSDGLAMLLAVLLALAIVAFLARPAAWRLWLATTALLALVMTRAEWAAAVLPLYLLLLLVVGWRRVGRRLVGHAVAGAGAIYGALAALVAQNAVVNGFSGLTDAENINLYGKVTQYNMQNLAPGHYAALMRLTDHAIAHGTRDPWRIYWSHPALGQHHFAQIGTYARTIIVHHPLEFVAKTVPVFFRALFSHPLFATIRPRGLLATPLTLWSHVAKAEVLLFAVGLLAGLAWCGVLLFKKRVARRWQVASLAALTLLALYNLIVISLSSYDEYSRLHLESDPLLLVVAVGSLLWLARRAPALWHTLRSRRGLAAYRPRRAAREERSAA